MSVEIQEPNDIPGGSLTPATENNYEILVYQKAEDAAGIKRMAISGWRDYLGFNSHKVNNVASYVGMPSDYPWNEDSDIPYEGTTVTNQIDTLATKLGISQEPGTFDPLYPRFQTVEDEVNGTGSPASGGLMQRMSQAETDIQSIEEEIGSSGGGSGSLTARINALETTVGDDSSGLVQDVADINTEIGDDTTASSIKGRIKVVEDNVASNTTDIGNLQTTVGDSTLGLVKNVAGLQLVVGDDNSGLVKQVHDLESKVYFYKGNITDVTNSGDTTTEITVDDTTTIQVNVNDLKNGWVYNINPSNSSVGSLIINGEKYNRGENVAIINDGSTIKFDKLGSNIDVEEVNKIAARYGSQQIASNESYDVGNLLTTNGVYQLTVCPTSGAIRIPSIIIITWFSGSPAIGSDTDIIKITPDNFSTYWEFDSGVLSIKSSAGNKTITFTKIGDI